MTDQFTPSTASQGTGSGGTAQAAKDVAGRGAERASNVAGEAMTEAKAVAREAKDHVRDLVDRGRGDLGDEAAARTRQAAGSVRTFADRMGALAEGNTDAAGPLADLAREGRERLNTFANRLDEGPNAVLDDLRRFARRQPMMFLASAGALGFIAGRLLRAGREAQSDSEFEPQSPPMGIATTSAPPPVSRADGPLPAATVPAAPTPLGDTPTDVVP